jgi:hypothetical protein
LSKSLSAIFLVAIVGVFYVFFFDSSDTGDEQDTVTKQLESVPNESVSAPPEMPKEQEEITNGIEDIYSQPSVIESASTEVTENSSANSHTRPVERAKEKKEDPKYIQYKANLNCQGYFIHKTDNEIDDYLIHATNTGSIESNEERNATELAMKEGLKACAELIGDRTEEEFYEDTIKLVRESAMAGNDEAQLSLALQLQQQSSVLGEEHSKYAQLYKEHMEWLNNSSVLGNAQAKIFLALAHLDPIQYPEYFDLERANLLVEEARGITGKDLTHLQSIIDGF